MDVDIKKLRPFERLLYIYPSGINVLDRLLWGDIVKDEQIMQDNGGNLQPEQKDNGTTKTVLGYIHDLVYLLGAILVVFLNQTLLNLLNSLCVFLRHFYANMSTKRSQANLG